MQTRINEMKMYFVLKELVHMQTVERTVYCCHQGDKGLKCLLRQFSKWC